MNSNKSIQDWFSALMKIVLAGVVLIFLGSESISFFTWIFPPEQWFMAYTGFGLTSGALLVYLYLFLNNAKTDLQNTVAICMVVVGIIGELATAGFGMQIEAWNKAGWEMAQSDVVFMVWIIRILMLSHALALLAYSYGDRFVDAFDKNRNGVPDFMENKNQPMKQNASDAQLIQELRQQIEELKAANPTQAGNEKK